MALALGLVLTAVAPANAQTFHMRVSVPFPFLAGEQMHAAGNYSVVVNRELKTLDLRAADQASAERVSLAFTPVTRRGNDPNRDFVRFEKIGSSFVLKGVWGGGQQTGFQTRRSGAEREMAARGGGSNDSAEVSIQAM